MLCICSHPFFNHRCLSLSWKPTLQLAPLPFSGGLWPVHSGRNTREPLSIATQWGAGQKRAKKGLSEVTQDALWSLLAGVILEERAGTSQNWWYQPRWEWWEEVGAADTPSEEFCWKTMCKDDQAHDCYHVNEELFPSFRFYFFKHWLLGGVFCLSVLELLASSLAYGILVPQPGMESSPLLWQHEDFNHWTAG